MSTTRPLNAVSNDISARPLEWNPPRQAISRVPYLPGLDGMRALAVVAVMIYHTNNGWLPGGFIGVEVFFVISGYLITLLLIGEHEKHGRIDLKQFWLRRARRLLPALFFMMTLLMIYTAIFKRDTLGLLRGDVIAGLGYITNWYQIWVGAGYTASADFAPLRHLWSLAVEEQFYLVWPLVMVGLIRLGRRRLPDISRWLLLAALVIAVAVGRALPDQRHRHAGHPPRRATGTSAAVRSRRWTRCTCRRSRGRPGCCIGAAFAMLWRPVAVMRGPLRNKGRELDLIALAGLAALGALAYFLHVIKDDGHADAFLFRGGFLAVGIATVMVMAAVTHQGAIGRAAARQPGAELDRHPLVRAVPVPLADLPDHPRDGWGEAHRRRVRRCDGRDGGDHRVLVSLHRDADPQAADRPVVGAGPADERSQAAAADRRRRGRHRVDLRVRRREHGDRPAQAERRATGLERTSRCGHATSAS